MLFLSLNYFLRAIWLVENEFHMWSLRMFDQVQICSKNYMNVNIEIYKWFWLVKTWENGV